MSSQRIYLIGAGKIALSHARAVHVLPDAEQVSLFVADPNVQALTEFSEQYPQARVFDNAQTMLAEPALDNDIVIIATPPFNHRDLTCAALVSGRHVLCEKPLAMDQVQAQEMLATAKAHKRLLGCCSVRALHTLPAEEARHFLADYVLGTIYHVRFVSREQRNRPGIEYQPATLWFLDQMKSGGGTLMDRAPYEFTVLNDLFQPQRVDVLAAWLANPVTSLQLPSDTIFDVEQQAGATLRYHLADSTTFILNYERASCTHSEPQSLIEIEGLKGSLRWKWSWHNTKLTHSYDNNGLAESKTLVFPSPNDIDLTFDAKPLAFFYRHMMGQPSSALVNEQAIFNFSCIRAIYDCAQTGEAQTVLLNK